MDNVIYIDNHEPDYMPVVCYHPVFSDRFAIHFNENEWLFQDGDIGADGELIPNAIPMVFKSWRHAIQYAIQEGYKHVAMCLHEPHSHDNENLH